MKILKPSDLWKNTGSRQTTKFQVVWIPTCLLLHQRRILILHCNAQTLHCLHSSEPPGQQVLKCVKNWKMTIINSKHLTKVSIFYFYGIDCVYSILHRKCTIVILLKKLHYMTLLIDKRNLNSLERSSNSFIMTLEKFCHLKEICLFTANYSAAQCAVLTIFTLITCVVYLFLCAILNTKDKAIDSTRKWQKVRKYKICHYSITNINWNY